MRDVEHEVDVHVAGDGVGDGPLQLLRRPRGRRPPPLDRPRRPPARDGGDEEQPLRRQLLQPLGDRDRAVGQILDDDVRRRLADSIDGEPPEVEVTLVQLADATDEDARRDVSRRRRRRC